MDNILIACLAIYFSFSGAQNTVFVRPTNSLEPSSTSAMRVQPEYCVSFQLLNNFLFHGDEFYRLHHQCSHLQAFDHPRLIDGLL